MRPIDENTELALRGSRAGDELVVWVWYDGELMLPEPLPVAGWSARWSGGDRSKVQGAVSLDVKDPDGLLAPWMFDDPLGVGGPRLQVLYRVGGAGDIRVGWYRVTGNSVEESWSFRVIREDGYVEADSELPPHEREVAVPMGSSVSVEAEDLTVELDADEFLAPEQPSGPSPTVVGEVSRLVGDLPVIFRGITDEGVARDSVWETNRLETVLDLLGQVGAAHRMTGDGELECFVRDRTPVFTCAGGKDGVLINVTRSQSLTDVANVGVVTSTRKAADVDGQMVDVPIRGVYEIRSGPLRAGGPMGRRVARSENPLADSQAKADKAAEALALEGLRGQTLDLQVRCLPNPAIQVHDFGVVVTPVVDGRAVPLVGEVMSVGLSGSAGTVSSMELTVRCLLVDAAIALKNYSIGDRLTRMLPGLTYDTVNPLRTMDEMNTDTDGMTS